MDLPFDNNDRVSAPKPRRAANTKDVVYSVFFLTAGVGLLFLYLTKAPVGSFAKVSEVESVQERLNKADNNISYVIERLNEQDKITSGLEEVLRQISADKDGLALAINKNSVDLEALIKKIESMEKAPKKAEVKTKAVPAQKAVVRARPKTRVARAPSVNFRLNSIRHYGNQSVVSLSAQGQTSPSLRRGDSWKGWRVERIGNNNAQLQRSGQSVTVQL